MKILFFIYKLSIGGAERVLVNLSNELVNRGHEVIIALNEEEIKYDLDRRIKVYVAPKGKWSRKVKSPLRYIGILERWGKNRTFTKNTIHSTKPDVIVSFYHTNMESIIHFHGNIPIIMSEHNAFDRHLGLGHYIQRFIKSRSFSKVCVLTPFDQGYANAKGLRNVVVMPNPNTFKCLTNVEYDKLFLNRNNILACGRLDIWHVKGFDLAIQAFSKVAELNPNVDLDIVGDNSEKSVQILSQMANSYGVKERVHFWGRRTDVDELMRTHKLFILSSRTEGFPMVITEAMSQGLPCVAFERLASSIINDSIDGLLVNNEDVAEMSEAISSLLIDEKKRYQMGLNAAINVTRFSVERMTNRWEKMFLQLIHDNCN